MTMSIEEEAAYKNNHRKFTVNFFGTQITVIVTSTPSVVRKWLSTTMYKYREHMGQLVVGLGVQWVPPRYHRDHQPAATLQLCVGRRCLILQLNHAERVPLLLRRFLTSPKNYLVGLWNHSDGEKLQITKHNLEVGELFDMRHYAVSRRTGEKLYRHSIEEIIEECLGFTGVRWDMEISRSNWEAYSLSEEQIMQACVDAHVSFLIGRNVRIWETDRSSDMDVD